MIGIVSKKPPKGRGAVSNISGRYERYATFPVDDGWQFDTNLAPAPFRTTVMEESPKTVITYNQSPDVPFNRSLNAYRGCEHGCIYCFARPTHAYQGMSPGLDFESKLFAKPDAAVVLEKELRKPGYSPETLAIGTNTDPYQPIERTRRITREVLEVLSNFNHPTAIITKSQLILRDLDILASMAERDLLSVGISVTTLDQRLSRIMEPRAPTPKRRLETIRKLAEASIPVTVMLAPIIPAINDHEIETIVAATAETGAIAADYILLRLPREVKDLFQEWLIAHYPDRVKKVLSLTALYREGKLYSSDWFKRMRGEGPYADLLEKRFTLACKRMNLRVKNARTPILQTDVFQSRLQTHGQLSLF